MRTCSRAAALATSLVGLVFAGSVLAGCSDRSAGDGDTESPAAPVGDVPFSLVLPDELAVSDDGTQVLADCWDGICRWDTTDGSLDRVDGGSHVALSPDWSLIAGVGDDATVVLVDAESGDVVRELAGHHDEEIVDGSPIQDIAFSPDGTMVASAGLEGQVVVWSVADGSKITAIETGTDVSAVSFSPDGSSIATAGGAPVQVFDVPSGDLVSTLSDSSPDAAGLSWSPDGRWLAAAGPGGGPAVWRVEDFVLTEELTGRSMKELAFAPDSRTLAVTDTEDDTVRLWTPKALGGTERDVRELVGHTDEPGAVAFAPDGATLYSVAGTDGVFAWEVRTGKLATEFELPAR
jgi:WD40 repeat protein